MEEQMLQPNEPTTSTRAAEPVRDSLYRAVMLPRIGGPEGLRGVDLPLFWPGPNELWVRIPAAGGGSPDLIMLAGTYKYAPPMPFVPGYEIAGVVDAVGAEVKNFQIGQRVAAL